MAKDTDTESGNICNAKTEVYSRVVGFYRPVQQWNDGKQQEFKERKTFSLKTLPNKENNTFISVQ